MIRDSAYNLSVGDVAAHYVLTPGTIRRQLLAGALRGVRVDRIWRCSWQDVWAAEQGPAPRGQRAAHYRAPLLRKRDLVAAWGVSERTVERWIADGLPTRNVFGSVRIAPVDAGEWTRGRFGIPGVA